MIYLPTSAAKHFREVATRGKNGRGLMVARNGFEICVADGYLIAHTSESDPLFSNHKTFPRLPEDGETLAYYRGEVEKRSENIPELFEKQVARCTVPVHHTPICIRSDAGSQKLISLFYTEQGDPIAVDASTLVLLHPDTTYKFYGLGSFEPIIYKNEISTGLIMPLRNVEYCYTQALSSLSTCIKNGLNTPLADEALVALQAKVRQLEPRTFTLEQLKMLEEALQLAKCGEAGERECGTCDYRTGPGEFDCLCCLLIERIDLLEQLSTTK